jgi:hypothetical protein
MVKRDGTIYSLLYLKALLSLFSFKIYYIMEICKSNAFRKESLTPITRKISLRKMHISFGIQ